MTSPLLYIFLHLPRTAGTTLRLHLEGSLRWREILLLYQSRDPDLTLPVGVERRIRRLTADRRQAVKVLFGHKCYYGMHELFPGREPRYVTFLRHPFEQFVSRYNYGLTTLRSLGRFHRRFVPGFRATGGVVSLTGALRANPDLENYTFRFLFTHLFPHERRRGEVNAANLDRVLDALASFYFLGLTERPEDQLFLYHELGIRRFFPPQNVSRKHARLDRLEPATRSAIERGHTYDQAIYDYAVRANTEFRSAQAGFAAAVEETRRRRDAYLAAGWSRQLPWRLKSAGARYTGAARSLAVRAGRRLRRRRLPAAGETGLGGPYQ